MDSDELMVKVNQYLENEGSVSKQELSSTEVLDEFILPGLKASKDVLSTVYSFQVRNRTGFVGKAKNLLQTKIVNTIINVLEKTSMRQQKFNELTYRAIEALVAENQELKKKLSSK